MPTDRPTIAHVLHRLYLAGAEVLAAALARELRDRFNFVFLCLDEIGPLGRQLADEGFKVVDLKRKPGVDLSVARRIREVVRRENIQLLHAHQYTPFFYASISRGMWGMLRARPRVLFTEHGRHYPDIRKRKRILANKLLLRGGDRVTAVGKFVRQALISNEGIRGDRIEVVYNGIDETQFAADPTGQVRAAVRSELNIGEKQTVVMQVARFHPVKDHETGIRGFAAALQLAAEAPSRQGGASAAPPADQAPPYRDGAPATSVRLAAEAPSRQGGASAASPADQAPPYRDGAPAMPLLLLIGDGERKTACEKLAMDLNIADHVRFLGVRSDVPRLMQAADVFMLSSLSEGISVTLLEAMGAGIPIATTNVGGNAEVVAAGESGLLSPRGDAEALGRNLATLIADRALRARMGQAGTQRLIQTFTQRQMHERYAAIYDEILRGGASSNVPKASSV